MRNLIFSVSFLSIVLVVCIASTAFLSFDENKQEMDEEKQMMKDMVFIETGSLNFYDNGIRRVSINNFYILNHEITNKEYRKFIKAYLKDSLVSLGKDSIMKSFYPISNIWEKELKNQTENLKQEWKNYFENPKFDNYPVVSISWKAANEYCKWRTAYLNTLRRANGQFDLPPFRLPFEAEYEYAALGGNENNIYSWKSDSLHDNIRFKSKFRANFQILEDKFPFTAPIKKFAPNSLNIYDMSGNVAEMCLDAYSKDKIFIPTGFFPGNPVENEPLKVIKGGSWKDNTIQLRCRSRQSFHEDSVSATVGFRVAMTYLGRSKGTEF